ncbi:MAG: hypothetical protein COA78_05600 [Blastopirellula sp.]|nr:MAG: hypothetical protein COA78_05600 [Blastopirellula sp.]
MFNSIQVETTGLSGQIENEIGSFKNHDCAIEGGFESTGKLPDKKLRNRKGLGITISLQWCNDGTSWLMCGHC